MRPCLALVALAAIATCLSPARGLAGTEDAVALPRLVGRWLLVAVHDEPAPAGHEPAELEVHPDGRLAGGTGVNRLKGRLDLAALSEDRFESEPLVVTRRAGTPEAMERERAILGVLGGRARAWFSSDLLRLESLPTGRHLTWRRVT
jgi:heat shock protein HslJ